MDLAKGGDLLQRINFSRNNIQLIKEEEIWMIFFHTLSGIDVLHQKKIVHRDIKPANIFLANDGKAQIGDLNVSKIAKQKFLTTFTGTPFYMSPEIYKGLPYDEKTDIWSLGCILYELATLQPPFTANNIMDLRLKQIPKQDSLASRFLKLNHSRMGVITS
ncbi:protein kinase domain containing protein [Stylonychia lemnae]|uniref:non-specific serine/threonine protein kinase n=1 Tax=Stylonychia lemnae TaxID=5949 RepID=A0A078AJN2_STYLE|nr:protein kinase domain containing protein [Stylonychia lemnae]|eukprot:CDW81682.1 protein kinase domain containing protein [Stylonychia lemnae]